MKIYAVLAVVLLVIVVVLSREGEHENGTVPRKGFVPDAVTAERIAEAVWIPIYGEKTVESEKPFKTTRSDDVWTVEGTVAPGARGQIIAIQIAEGDGQIVEVGHGK